MKKRVQRKIAIVFMMLMLITAGMPIGTNVANAQSLGVGHAAITKIAARGSHSLALKSDGSVVAWGSNSYGESTVPVAAQNGVVAIAAGNYHSLALKSDGSVVAWGSNNHGQISVPTAAKSGVVAIAAGFYHSLALKSDGSVVAWGNNSGGQGTVPTAAKSGVVAIAAGGNHNLALKSDGSVVAWGYNNKGQTNVPTAAKSGVVAIAGGAEYSLALKSDGSVVAWGSNNYGQISVPTAAQSGVVAIAAGYYHSLALKSDGSVVAWGSNAYGQTTVPTAAQSGVEMIAAGGIFSLALKSDGSVVAWGSSRSGETNVPSGISNPVKGIRIAGGGYHSLALKSDGSVVAWGRNDHGQTTVPTSAQSGVEVIDAGYYHSLALKTDGSVVAWGNNGNGQTTVPSAAQSGVIAIAAGSYHSLALKSDGSVVAWGSNSYGESTVPVAAQNGVVAIAAGNYHSLALKSDGSVVAWGSNNHGQISVPTAAKSGVVAITAGGNNSLALKSDGSVVEWGNNNFGQTTVPTAAQSDVVAIAAGFQHSLALKSDGSVVAWGRNSLGQGTIPFAAQSGVVAIAAGGYHSLAMRSDGSVVAWGDHTFGQTTVPGSVNLNSLTLDAGAISPAFDPTVTSYTFQYVGASVTSVNVTATLADATNDDVYINGQKVTSGSPVSAPITGASTAIPIKVDPYLLAGKTYTLTVKQDSTAPSVSFSMNGNSTYAKSASTTITVSDSESGVKPSTLQYAWTQSASTPSGGTTWTPFTSGDTLLKSGVDGDWYLHIQATDNVGNTADIATNRFRLDNTVPTVSFGTNGSSTYAKSASTTVTVSDSLSGVDAGSLKFAWTQSASTPGGGTTWTSFTNGDALTKGGVDGDWYLHIQAKDNVGNTTDVVTNRFRLDNTAPTVTIPLQNPDSSTYTSGDWTKQNVTASVYANDANTVTSTTYSLDWGTTWQLYSTPLTFSSDGSHTLEVKATDNAGNTSSVAYKTVNISQKGLDVNLSFTNADSTAYSSVNWTNQNVTASVYAYQTTPGVTVTSATYYSLNGGSTWQAYTSPIVFNSEGTHTMDVKATDSAANTFTVSKPIRIDRTAPTATVQLQNRDSSTYTSGDWTNQNVTATLSATDALSGVNRKEYSLDGGTTWQSYYLPLTFYSDGSYTLKVRAIDNAGNTSSVVTKTINITRTGLTVDVSLKTGSTAYTSGVWTKQDVTANVNASQSTTGITVTSTKYSLDGGNTWSAYTSPIGFNSEGTYTLVVNATDSAGNTITASKTIRIDRTVPAISFGTNGSGTSYMQSVSTTATVIDSGSGINSSTLQYAWTGSTSTPGSSTTWTSFTNGDTLSKSGVDGDWYLHIQATDNIGNTADVATSVFHLDNSAPTVTVPMKNQDNTTYTSGDWTNQNVTASVNAADGLSGINAIQYSLDGGITWQTYTSSLSFSSDGAVTLDVKATDSAGNTLLVSKIIQIDQSAPTVSFGTNGNSSAQTFVSTTVTVTDSGSGIDPTTLQYVWTQSASTPSSGTTWTNFTNGDILTQNGVSGDGYLHIQAKDMLGNTMNTVSNRFQLYYKKKTIEKGVSLFEGSSLIDIVTDVKKVTREDGTIVEQITLNPDTLSQALTLLKNTDAPHLTIEVNDTERVVQVQLPASSIVSAAKSMPNAIIEVKLNGSSYQLAIRALDLQQMAKQLGVDLKDLNVNVIIERAGQQTEDGIRQLANTEGFHLASSVIDFKVTVEANGKTEEISDFGGTYMARAIVPNTGNTGKNLIGVLYDPVTKQFIFVPSQSGSRSDGTQEMVMNVPHNSMYAVLETTGKTFADLSGHWARADVELLASKLIVKGITAHQFAPNADITRAELTALLVRSLGISTMQSESTSFKDIPSNAWYAPAIEAAVKAGLIHGYADGTFKPNEPISREEIAVLIDRARTFVNTKQDQANVTDVLNRYADRGAIAEWAKQQIANLVQDGLVNGRSADHFAPKAHTTRAEAAVLIERLLKQLHFIN